MGMWCVEIGAFAAFGRHCMLMEFDRHCMLRGSGVCLGITQDLERLCYSCSVQDDEPLQPQSPSPEMLELKKLLRNVFSGYVLSIKNHCLSHRLLCGP